MSQRVCPWWLGYVLAAPVRKIRQDPAKILSYYIHEGDTVLDVGCGMGFFSLPMAHMVGEGGRVVCVDLQEKMIRGLRKRASRSGVESRMEMRECTQQSICIDTLAGTIDCALAFAVVHEVPDQARFLGEIYSSLRRNGQFLFSEPSGHVSLNAFNKTVVTAQEIGFGAAGACAIPRSHSMLFLKA